MLNIWYAHAVEMVGGEREKFDRELWSDPVLEEKAKRLLA